jgi:protein transport protein SEC13
MNSTLETQHEDMIHDAQLDYYGKRLATCSSDRSIKIFMVEGDNPQSHQLTATLKGHEGPVWQVSWAHPKFGSILASCSYDRRVLIWKEIQDGQWQIVFDTEATHESSVNSIAWAPNECGLALASGSSDGSVSVIYYKETVGWTVKKRDGAHNMGCNAVSWAPFGAAGAALGGPAPVPTTSLLATAGCDNKVKVWRWNGNDLDVHAEMPQAENASEASPGHKDWVRDVAYSPALAMLKNVLASGSQDSSVIFWEETNDTNQPYRKICQVGFPAVVWRVSWSTTGLILAVSCADNNVYLLKQTSNDSSSWEIVSQMDNAAD